MKSVSSGPMSVWLFLLLVGFGERTSAGEAWVTADPGYLTDEQGTEVDSLPLLTTLEVTGQRGERLQVRLSDDTTGWIHAGQVRQEPFFAAANLGPEDALKLDECQALLRRGWAAFDEGDHALAIERMTQATRQAREILGDENIAASRGLADLGYMQWISGDAAAAQKTFDDGLAIVGRLGGEEHPYAFDLYNNRAVAAHGDGDTDVAKELYKKAVTIAEKHFDRFTSDRAIVIGNLATLHADLAEYDRAAGLWLESLTIQARVFGPESLEAASAAYELALVEYHRGNIELARDHLDAALSTRQARLGPDHLETAQTLLQLGIVLRDSDDPKKAQGYFERAIEGYAKASPEPPLAELGVAHSELGLYFLTSGELDKSQAEYEEALRVFEQIEGGVYDLAYAHLNLGDVLGMQGEFARAEEQIKAGLTIMQEEYGEADEDTAYAHSLLGDLYREASDPLRALVETQKSLSGRRAVFGEDDLTTAESRNQLGNILFSQGNYEPARGHFAEVLRVRQALLEPWDLELAAAYQSLADAHYFLGEYEASLPHFLAALEIRDGMLEAPHELTARSHNDLGHTFRELGDLARSKEEFTVAWAARKELFGDNNEETFRSRQGLADVLYRLEEYREARAHFVTLRDAAEEIFGAGSLQEAKASFDLGECELKLGNHAAARRQFEKALTIYEDAAAETAQTAVVHWELAEALFGLKQFDNAKSHYQKSLTLQSKIFGPNSEQAQDLQRRFDAVPFPEAAEAAKPASD